MADAIHLLNSTVEQWRTTLVDDGGGGQEAVKEKIADLPARLSQPSASERQVAAQAGADLTHIVHTVTDADVRRGDELHHGGRVLDVDAVYEPSTPGVYLRADCAARQPGGM